MLLMALVGTVCAVGRQLLLRRRSPPASAATCATASSIAWRISRCTSSISFSTASLITRTTNDTTQVQQVLIMMMTHGHHGADDGDRRRRAVAVAGHAAGARADRRDSDPGAIVFFLIMRKAMPLFQQMQVKIDRLNLVLDEGLTGVRVIRAFDRNAHESRRFDAANRDLTDNAIAVNRLVVDADAGDVHDDEPHQRGDHLVRRAPHRRRTDAGRRDDGVAAVRHADPVLGVHGHGDVRDAAARGRIGGAHQRGARRDSRRQRSRRSPQSPAGSRPARPASNSRTSRSSIRAPKNRRCPACRSPRSPAR